MDIAGYEEIQRNLYPGESLLWVGKSVRFRNHGCLIAIPFLAFMALVLFISVVDLNAADRNVGDFIFPGVFLLFALLVVINALRSKSLSGSNIIYGVSDRRAFRVTGRKRLDLESVQIATMEWLVMSENARRIATIRCLSKSPTWPLKNKRGGPRALFIGIVDGRHVYQLLIGAGARTDGTRLITPRRDGTRYKHERRH